MSPPLSRLRDEFPGKAMDRSQVCCARGEIEDELVDADILQCCKTLTDCLRTAHKRGISELIPHRRGKQSKRRFIVLSNGADSAGGAVDRREVSSQRFTMRFEHSELMPDRLQVTKHIAGIAILRDQLECDLLSAAANQERDVRLLHPLGLIDGATSLVIRALEGGLFLRPHGKNDLECFAQHAQALRGIRIGIAIRSILVLVPSRPNAEIQAAM